MAKQPFRIDGGLKAGSVGIQELDSAAQLQAIPVGLDSVAVTGSIFTLAEVDVANGAAMSAYQVLRWNSNTSKFTADDDSDTFLIGTTDASNTALGVSALATGGGADNVAIGHSALAVSTGSGNVALGDDAGSALVSGDNNVIIGRNDGSSIEGKDGQLIIANGAGTVVMSADSAQKVSFAAAADVAGVLTFGSTTETTDKISEGSVNLYYTRARWDSALGSVSTADVSEGSNLYYTTVRFDSDFSGKTTDDLSEGSTNLYYTETNFDNTLATKTTDDLTEGTNLYYTLARFDSALGTITTDDLTQGSVNLYYSDSSFNISLASKTTSDLTEGTNLYYTLARFDSALSTITTDNITEGSNQYYTDARFDSAFNAKSTDDLSEGSTNLYYTETRFDTSLSSKTTTDVAEGSTNEYYTVARFDSAFGAKSTADITEDPSALFFTNARAQAAIAGAYTGGTGVTYDSSTSTASIGQPVETTSDVQFGSAVIDGRKAIETAEVTTSATAQATIDTFPIADFRSGTYTITVTEGTNYQSTEMLVTHDDTSAYMVEFGTLTTGSDLADFDVAINGTDLEVKATPASANSTEFKIVRHLVGENITTGQGSGSGSGGSGSGGSGSGGSGGGSSSYSLTTALEADQLLFLDPTDTTNATTSNWTNTASPTNPATTALQFDVANVTFETSGSTNIGYVMDASSTIQPSAGFNRANSGYQYPEIRLGSDYDGSGTSDYTLTYWVKTTSTLAHSGAYQHGMGLGGDTNNDGGISSGISNGQIVWSYYSGGWNRVFSTGTVNDGDWHCIIMTFNNGTLKMYIDGVLDSTHTGVGYSPGYYIFDHIGSALADKAFIGTMGAIRVFASELTASEVETVFDVEAQQYGLTPIN